MIKTLLFLFVFVLNAYANIKNLEGTYHIEYGVFGKLGEAKASIKVKDDNSYEIKARAEATGLAKTLSGSLVEDYLSKGFIENNKYKPQYFKKTTNKNGLKKTQEYFFDYKNKIITKKSYKKKKEKIVDLSDLSKDKYIYKEKTKEEKLKFWANEDILSLFFNLKNYIDLKDKGKIKIVSAVGASSKREGKIDIKIPDEKRYKKISEYIQDDGDILIVKIYKKIFASKEGEFFLSINEDGLCNKTILKDVMFFGDITATLQGRVHER